MVSSLAPTPLISMKEAMLWVFDVDNISVSPVGSYLVASVDSCISCAISTSFDVVATLEAISHQCLHIRSEEHTSELQSRP